MKSKELIATGEKYANEQKWYLAIDYFKEAKEALFLEFVNRRLSETEMHERSSFLNQRLSFMKSNMNYCRFPVKLAS